MRKILLLISGIFLVACQKNANTYNGYIDADLTYLSSDFAGRISSLYVSRGESVSAGQILFKLEQTNEQRNIAIGQSNQENLQAQRQQIQDRINYTQNNYVRLQKLQAQGAASSDELEQAQQNLNVLKKPITEFKCSINWQ